tara:strand:+ start:519 stop:746 length:228 start_codon:yes stop_codon:yes gene_type:complete
MYRRLEIQATRRRAQEGATFSKSGKGTKRKLKALDSFRQKEKQLCAPTYPLLQQKADRLLHQTSGWYVDIDKPGR